MQHARHPRSIRQLLRRPALTAALALACASGLRAQDAGGIALGMRAPVVSAQDLAGRTVALAAVGRRPTLIEFWATWCPYCEKLEPRMKAAHARFGRQVQFYAVAVNVNESPARVARHVAQRRLAYPVLYDASGAATREFDVPATSFVVLTDASGRVVYTGVGGDQDLDAALARVTRPVIPIRPVRPVRPGGKP